MKIFQCSHCSHVAFFENTVCEQCGNALGYDFEEETMLSSEGTSGAFKSIENPEKIYRYCANRVHGVCNWLVPESSPEELCCACSLNRTIPDIEDPKLLQAWRKIESAKHRLVYSLLRLGLKVEAKIDDEEEGVCFDFLSDSDAKEEAPVLTGHSQGVITMNVAEADSVYREQARKNMSERYRTLEGHLRHEIGHYYWEVLIQKSPEMLKEFRRLFGDERLDYSESLESYYEKGPIQDWQSRFITAYSSAHPWEDWAESWAHYFHCMDTLETAYSFGISVCPSIETQPSISVVAGFDPYHAPDFEKIIKACVPLMLAINSMNRSMGQPDIYPFVFPNAAIEKLAFIHQLLTNGPQSIV